VRVTPLVEDRRPSRHLDSARHDAERLARSVVIDRTISIKPTLVATGRESGRFRDIRAIGTPR
jgi:hypothetical protein